MGTTKIFYAFHASYIALQTYYPWFCRVSGITVCHQINIQILGLTQLQYIFMFEFLATRFGPHKDLHQAFMYKNF